MAFLTLLGITIPVAASSSGRVETSKAGEYARTQAGKPIPGVRARGYEYRGSTTLQSRSLATAYRLLLAGYGHAFPFDAAGSGATTDYYSTKGMKPSSFIGAGSYSTTATGGPVGSGGYLTVVGAQQLVYAMRASPLQKYTVACWYKGPANGNTWKHYVGEYNEATTTASYWENGASTGSPPADISTITTGGATLAWAAFAAETVYFAEGLWLPFAASELRSDFASYLYNGGSGRAVEALPFLTMGGDWPESGSDTVLGEVLGSRLTSTVVSGNTVEYEAFDFVLRSRNVR